MKLTNGLFVLSIIITLPSGLSYGAAPRVSSTQQREVASQINEILTMVTNGGLDEARNRTQTLLDNYPANKSIILQDINRRLMRNMQVILQETDNRSQKKRENYTLFTQFIDGIQHQSQLSRTPSNIIPYASSAPKPSEPPIPTAALHTSDQSAETDSIMQLLTDAIISDQLDAANNLFAHLLHIAPSAQDRVRELIGILITGSINNRTILELQRKLKTPVPQVPIMQSPVLLSTLIPQSTHAPIAATPVPVALSSSIPSNKEIPQAPPPPPPGWKAGPIATSSEQRPITLPLATASAQPMLFNVEELTRIATTGGAQAAARYLMQVGAIGSADIARAQAERAQEERAKEESAPLATLTNIDQLILQLTADKSTSKLAAVLEDLTIYADQHLTTVSDRTKKQIKLGLYNHYQPLIVKERNPSRLSQPETRQFNIDNKVAQKALVEFLTRLGGFTEIARRVEHDDQKAFSMVSNITADNFTLPGTITTLYDQARQRAATEREGIQRTGQPQAKVNKGPEGVAGGLAGLQAAFAAATPRRQMTQQEFDLMQENLNKERIAKLDQAGKQQAQRTLLQEIGHKAMRPT